MITCHFHDCTLECSEHQMTPTSKFLVFPIRAQSQQRAASTQLSLLKPQMTARPLGPVKLGLPLDEDFSRSKVIKGQQAHLIWVSTLWPEVSLCLCTILIEEDTSFAVRNRMEAGTFGRESISEVKQSLICCLFLNFHNIMRKYNRCSICSSVYGCAVSPPPDVGTLDPPNVGISLLFPQQSVSQAAGARPEQQAASESQGPCRPLSAAVEPGSQTLPFNSWPMHRSISKQNTLL